MRQKYLSVCFLTLVLLGCNDKVENQSLFSSVDTATTKIDFINTVHQSYEFNFLLYQYVYNGGGVAVGDINNDGFEDVYFTANQGSNKLYLNKGDFEFEDITNQAGVSDKEGWTTGVSMVDINADGFLDMYVCKSGSPKKGNLRRNKLFINQGNGEFSEEARKWKLDKNAFSVQSYFLDYDLDGDLDMYLVNHRPDFNQTRKIEPKIGIPYVPTQSDNLLRNDGGFFTDVTVSSGMVSRAWGLSASIGDFNQDGWPDVFVANDYIQPDFMYINNQDGTFTDESLTTFSHISYNSMGSDYADINNDLLPDLVVLDMLAADHIRSKENMATMNTKGFSMMVESDYHYSNMSNMLQLNNGNGTFKEIAQFAGMAKTDWSWAPMIADFDNDGHQDLIVTNGIERDLTNQDYFKELQGIIRNRIDMSIDEVEKLMPAHKLSNYVFRNKGGLSFEDVTKSWGLDQPVNSNGIAYADLDNDGDLDLVINNQSDPALIFKNTTHGNFLKIRLEGDEKNPRAIGAEVIAYAASGSQYRQLFASRGYQSSVSQMVHFGFGQIAKIDSLIVNWGNASSSFLRDLNVNQTLVISKKDSIVPKNRSSLNTTQKSFSQTYLTDSDAHQPKELNDFALQTLLPQKQSTEGPPMAVGDVNGDGLDDLFVGNGPGVEGVLYMQRPGKKFDMIKLHALTIDKKYDDWGALFFDCDRDGDLDLYVASGAYTPDTEGLLLRDRLYINDGNGGFSKSTQLPGIQYSTKAVEALDFDGDGDEDLVVGGHIIPGKYPLSPGTYLLENEHGRFTEVTKEVAPELSSLGMVNDIAAVDIDQDGDEDLIIVGEWMPLTLWINNEGSFHRHQDPVLENTSGWWQTIEVADLDADGDPDFLIGNFGQNNKFHPTSERPLHIFASYFDENETFDIVLSKQYNGNLVPIRGKECSTEQNPFVSENTPSYKLFAQSSLEEIYSEEKLDQATHLVAHTMSNMILYNNGSLNFSPSPIPSYGQLGPTLGFGVTDLNDDGYLDVVGVGGVLNTEVETIRYDANTGYILLGDSLGQLNNYVSNIEVSSNAKSLIPIDIDGHKSFMIGIYDGRPVILKN